MLMQWAEEVRNHPLYDPALDNMSTEDLIEQMKKDNIYVMVAEGVPPPLPRLEPGSIVIFDYEGMSARWMNGYVFVLRSVYEKQNQAKRTRR